MITLNVVRGVTAATIPVGHVAVIRSLGQKLVMRGISPGDDRTFLVFLVPNAAPKLLPFQATDTQCVDLGQVVAAVAAAPTSFTQIATAAEAGSLAIDEHGASIICQDEGDMTYRLHLQTGVLRPNNTAACYVSEWQLGVAGLSEKFQKLYEHPTHPPAA